MSGTALPTDGRFPVRRKRPNRPSVDNAHRASWRPLNGYRFSFLRGHVEAFAALNKQADRLEATDPVRAAALRRQASRIGR